MIPECINNWFRVIESMKNENTYKLAWGRAIVECIYHRRYYLDVNEKSFNGYLIGFGLILLESVLSEDVRPGRNERWLNIILKKEPNGKK